MSLSESWYIVIPEATTNMVLNPSAEIAGNFAAEGGATTTRVTTYQKYAFYSYRVQTAANGDGIAITLGTLSNSVHYVTMGVAGDLPLGWRWSLDGSGWVVPTRLQSLNADWDFYGAAFSAGQSNGSTTLYIEQYNAGAGDFYLDGIQVEAKDYWTTYCDGTQEGCEWNGPQDASTSTRSVLSRAGGRPRGLYEGFGFFVEKAVGTGTTSLSLGINSYALLPGGEISGIKDQSRTFQLIGKFFGVSEIDLHRNRQAFINATSKDAVPQDEKGYQPIRLRFAGAEIQKEISVHYQSGLEGDLETFYCKMSPGDDDWTKHYTFDEKLQVQFAAPDPYWYEVGNSAAVLDTNDSFNPNYILEFNKDTGQWGALGAGPGITVVDIIVDDANNIIYACGANAVYSWSDGAWTILGGIANAIVSAIALAPDGTLYAGGAFTTIGVGPVAADYIAYWDGAAWNAFASEPDDYVECLAVSLDGILYAGGAFANTDDGPAADIASWDGAAWSALGAGLNAVPADLIVGVDGTLYASGDFTQAGGSTVNYIASWDGAAWSDLDGGADAFIDGMAFGDNGLLYVGGGFSAIGSISANQVASWNGTSWAALGDGVTGNVNTVETGPDGIIYFGGTIITAGDIGIVDRAAGWNGYTFFHLGFNLAGTPTVATIGTSKIKNIAGLYNIYIGLHTNTGNTTYTGGSTTITNNGIKTYPTINFYRTGGTSATVQIVLSATTGRRIYFDYDLLDAELLTINLTPQIKTIVSNFFGQRFDAMLPNSDFGEFSLLTGDNDIVTFVDVAGAPTITAWMEWRDAYASWD